MTSLGLHLKVVSLNHYEVNSVSIESIRTPEGVLGVFQSVYLHFLPCILSNLTLYVSIYENIQCCSIKSLSKFISERVKIHIGVTVYLLNSLLLGISSHGSCVTDIL